jgi:hypothetical protein
MYQQLWGYKVEEKLYLGVHEQKRLNTTVLTDRTTVPACTLCKEDALTVKGLCHDSLVAGCANVEVHKL